MKNLVKQKLKEKGSLDIFREDRYLTVKEVMKYAMSKDQQLKCCLNISPDFKVDFIVDHMIKYVADGKI